LQNDIIYKYENIIKNLIIGLKETYSNSNLTNEIEFIKKEVQTLINNKLILNKSINDNQDFIIESIYEMNKNKMETHKCPKCFFVMYNKIVYFAHNYLCK
jgi:hypothetical protein